MRLIGHLKLLMFVTIAWLLFWVAGLPDYYQQYSWKTMLVFDLVILPPIWLIIYRSVNKTRIGSAFIRALWWAFYISMPLFIYDFLYAGLYLGYGLDFLRVFWYLTVYYVLPWVIFPPMGWLIDQRKQAASTSREAAAGSGRRFFY